MFNFDKIEQAAEDFKKMFSENLPKVEEKFQEMQMTITEASDTVATELQFASFMSIASFFFIAKEEVNEKGEKITKSVYLPDKHANTFMACRKAFEMVLAVQEAADAEGEENQDGVEDDKN